VVSTVRAEEGFVLVRSESRPSPVKIDLGDFVDATFNPEVGSEVGAEPISVVDSLPSDHRMV